MTEKILFVDDEVGVLEGYKRLLRRDFAIETAVGGDSGLEVLAASGPFAVVVSEMRMPRMDGVQFLTQVRSLAPETVRIMLTGYADVASAISAVNEGSIFRFLTKPCDKETLGKSLTAGLLQYRLITAERELLEKDSIGCGAGSHRSARPRQSVGFRPLHADSAVCAAYRVSSLRIPSPWRFEVAAMLSQLGCVTLDGESLDAVSAGRELSSEQQARYDNHPFVARDLLAHIPRLEQIAWIVVHQSGPPVGEQADSDLALGAHLLKLALSYDQLLNRGLSHQAAIARLRLGVEGVVLSIVNAMADLDSGPQEKRVFSVTSKILSAA